MKIIDLSQTITAAMPGYPGTPPTAVVQAATIASHGYAELQLTLHTHTGTHLDAPAHLLPGGRCIDQFDLDAFHGPAWVINLSGIGRPVIALADLLPAAEELARSSFLLLRTGWSDRWGTAAYEVDYPVLTAEAAAWLATFTLKGVGIDTLSLDPLDSHELANHRTLLRREILIVENLTNLAALPNGRVIFNCFPLKIKAADGAPVRAVAFVAANPGNPGNF